MNKQAIQALEFLNDPRDYGKSFSRGIRLVQGRTVTLYISGTASIDRFGKTRGVRDFTVQAERVFLNLSGLLRSEGASWRDVVQTRCYLKRMKDYGKFNEIRNRFYRREGLDPFPASVCVEANLCRPELLVEIEAIAVFSFRKRRLRREAE